MCAIFGVGLLSGHKIKDSDILKSTFRILAEEAESRGRTASGVAFVQEKNITTFKKDVAATLLVGLPEYDDVFNRCVKLDNGSNKLFSLVGHARLKTKGSQLQNENNHPIVCGNVVGTHNGMINNDDKVFDVYEKTFKRNGQVDSEIIFALMNYFKSRPSSNLSKAIDLTGRTLTGSIACAAVHGHHPHILCLFRRANPCTILLYKKVGLLFWASQEGFITKAVLKQDFGAATEIKLPVNETLSIDLLRNKYHRSQFSIYMG